MSVDLSCLLMHSCLMWLELKRKQIIKMHFWLQNYQSENDFQWIQFIRKVCVAHVWRWGKTVSLLFVIIIIIIANTLISTFFAPPHPMRFDCIVSIRVKPTTAKLKSGNRSTILFIHLGLASTARRISCAFIQKIYVSNFLFVIILFSSLRSFFTRHEYNAKEHFRVELIAVHSVCVCASADGQRDGFRIF